MVKKAKHILGISLCLIIMISASNFLSSASCGVLNMPLNMADKGDEFNLLTDDQKPIIERIGREEGLSNLSVSEIIQDKYGFFWIGTQGGLNFYDGHSFKIYRHDPFNPNSIPNNVIQTMYYDEEMNQLYIGTYGGLSVFDIASQTFTNYTVESHDLVSGVIVSILKDNKGDIWLSTLDGIYRKSDQLMVRYEIEGQVARELLLASNGKIYVGTYVGLMVYNENKDAFEQVDLDLPGQVITTVDEFKDGQLTLGVWDGGICVVDLASLSTMTIEVPNSQIFRVLKSRDGKLYVGTWGGGMYVFDATSLVYEFHSGESVYDLSHPVVYALYEDKLGILWIGTNGGGINYINPRNVNYLRYSHDPEDLGSLDAGKINDIFIDSHKRMWISIYNNGLNVLNHEGDFVKIKADISKERSLPNNSIRVITELDGKIVLGTDSGIGFFDYFTKTYTPWDKFQNLQIYDIEFSGDQVWIATGGNGVYKYDLLSQEVVNYRHMEEGFPEISDNHVYDILVDSKDRVWVATNNGLNLYDGNNYHLYTKDIDHQGLASNSCNVVYESKIGDIWIGLEDGGLARYNELKDNFLSYTEMDGLSSNNVVSIEEDKNNDLWVASNDGLSVLNFLSGEIKSFTYGDGIGGYEFSGGSYADDDCIYFGGVHGITAIPGKILEVEAYVPQMYIRDLRIYNESISSDQVVLNDAEFQLDYSDDFLTIDYVSLDYGSHSDMTYYCKLVGYDKDFINNGHNKYISYSHLPPGEYVFMVYGSNNRDIQTEIAKIEIKKPSPWYVSVNAYILYIFIVALIIFLFIKLREGIIVNRKNKELAIVNAKLEDANRRLNDLSQTDSLTKAYNRRYFSEQLDVYIQLARRTQNTYISLLMIDIDNYKKINDDYGHLAGDKLLQEISANIQKLLPRSTDILCRYGGDEFAVILYDTKINGGLIIGQKVRRAVEATVVTRDAADGRRESFGTTASIGVVSQKVDETTTEEQVVSKADQALYMAKESGKNKIIISE